MKKPEILFTFFLVVCLLCSCRNKSGKLSNSGESGTVTPKITIENKDSSENSSLGNEPDIVKDIDGNVYDIVKIGRQTWMVKNLKTTRYNDGTSIPLVSDSTTWASLSSPAFCWYDNDISSFKSSYGALYNGYSVNTGKLCPTGWHVPGDSEWSALTTFLGGENVAGEKLKETGMDFWVSPNTGANNASGFTALPGGLRYHDGIFHDFGFSGYWWTSTDYSESRTFFRYMDYEYSNVFRFNNLKKIGFSIRCLRDF